MTMINTRFILLSSFKNFIFKLRAYYGYTRCRWALHS